MKTFISRLLLLAAGLLCLSCGTPAQSQNASDSTTIMTIRKALKNAPKKSDPAIIKATYDESLNLINIAVGSGGVFDKNKNLIFDYKGKSFIHLSDEKDTESSNIDNTGTEKSATKESSKIYYTGAKKDVIVVIFNPNITDKIRTKN